MKNLGIVLGVAVVATLAGCKDPDYVSKRGKTPQNEVKTVTTEPAPVTVTVTDAQTGKPVADVKTEVKVEIVPAPEVKPVVVKEEPAFTWYTVRNGDYLAKISKKYNVTINGIKKLNPQIKGDKVLVGQKIKLPGVVSVEAAPAEAPKAAAPKASKKVATDYTGSTVDYVVKNGDTLGGIAYGHGINIRTLKKLNGLTSDNLKIGQKLKVPAGGQSVAKASAKAAPAAAKAAVQVEPAAAVAVTDAAPATTPADAAADAAASVDAAAAGAPAADAAVAPVEAAKPAPTYKTYVVQDGDDMAGLSLAWGVTASQIRELNNLGETDQLKPGQTIRVPVEADAK